MSRRVLLLVLVVLALPALALAAAKDPTKQINPGDQRKAASIVLKQPDVIVPGWKKVAVVPNGAAEPGCPGYAPDQSDLILTGEAASNFEGGQAKVGLESNVFKTRSDALASWTRAVKPALAPCLVRLFKQAIEQFGGKAAIVRSGQIAFPKFAPRTAAYRVSMTVSSTAAGKTTTIPFTAHVVALGNGRGDATLVAFGLGNGVPSADLRAFAKLVAGRLAAAKL
jgi:hypothetical protein